MLIFDLNRNLPKPKNYYDNDDDTEYKGYRDRDKTLLITENILI